MRSLIIVLFPYLIFHKSLVKNSVKEKPLTLKSLFLSIIWHFNLYEILINSLFTTRETFKIIIPIISPHVVSSKSLIKNNQQPNENHKHIGNQ